MNGHRAGFAGLLLLALPPVALPAGDVNRGAREFAQCTACHSVEPGRQLIGPSLAHVWGRKAGTAEGFIRYSEPLQRSRVVWDAQTLDKWLTNPQAFVPGTGMAFPGIRDAGERADLIAYLKAVSQGKAPAPPSESMMGGGMMSGAEPANLKQADPEMQVVSLRHCQDTYIIATAAGKTRKVWEYNVRLKTDSTAQGPQAGKPVVTGSVLRGDRVSRVFASPRELGQFIKESCD